MTAQDDPSRPSRPLGPTGPEFGQFIPGLAGDFDLKYGLRLLWAGKAWILVIAILGLGLGFLATYLQTPIYRSQALVQIDPPGQNLSALSNPYPATAYKSTTTRIAGGLMKAPRRGRSAPEYNRRNVAGSTPNLSLPTVRNPPEPFLAASSPIPSVKS